MGDSRGVGVITEEFSELTESCISESEMALSSAVLSGENSVSKLKAPKKPDKLNRTTTKLKGTDQTIESMDPNIVRRMTIRDKE